MPTPTRILLVASEISPFVARSPLADVVGSLPPALDAAGSTDVRSTVPCYGCVSARRHALHDVIRLSETEVPVGGTTEMLDVKVSSLPDTRLQVYFMEHADYFGREGLALRDDGTPFDDNAARALFFGRAVLETFRNLRWAPDVVHAFGWASALVPALLRTVYADDDVLGGAPVLYTPDAVPVASLLGDDLGLALGDYAHRALDGSTPAEATLDAVGRAYADGLAVLPGAEANAEALTLDADPEARGAQLLAHYDALSAASVAA
jgi:starch synthase